MEVNDILAYIHANSEEKLNCAKKRLLEIIKTSLEPIQKEQIILEIINGDGVVQ